MDLPVELGGGIRTEEAAERMLSLGVRRVIIGTKAAKEPEFMKKLWTASARKAIVAGVDAKNGPGGGGGLGDFKQPHRFKPLPDHEGDGHRHIVYTDISRDGTLTGPNVEATRELTEKTGLDVIASGGVSSMEDLRRLSEAGN